MSKFNEELYNEWTDEKLEKEHTYLMDIMRDNLSKKNLSNLYNLLDMERELTLREN